MKLLLGKGAKFKDKPPRYRNKAAEEGDIDMFEALLDAGADVDIEGSIQIFLTRGYLDLAYCLLHRLKTIKQGGCEKTLLGQAVMLGYEDFVRTLLQMGADPDIKEYIFRGGRETIRYALFFAAKNGHLGTTQLLWKGEAKIEFLSDPEQFLMGVEHEQICKLVAEDLPDLDLADGDGRRVLHLAAAHGHERSVRISLRRAADFSVKTASGMTPLHYAAQSRNTTVLGLILDQHIDIDACDADGKTALHHAAERARDSVVKTLLGRGASTEVKSKKKRLYAAALCCSEREQCISTITSGGGCRHRSQG